MTSSSQKSFNRDGISAPRRGMTSRNKDLQPAIQIRYAEPMTEAKLWELMTMETWTITYKKDDVREEGAKIGFKTPGVSYEYNE